MKGTILALAVALMLASAIPSASLAQFCKTVCVCTRGHVVDFGVPNDYSVFLELRAMFAEEYLSATAKAFSCEAAGLETTCKMAELVEPEVARAIPADYFNTLAEEHCGTRTIDQADELEDTKRTDKCNALVESWEFTQSNCDKVPQFGPSGG